MRNHAHRHLTLAIATSLLGLGSLACDDGELDTEAELAIVVDEDPDPDALGVDAPDVDLEDYELVADLDTPADPAFATSLDTRERWGLELEDGIYMIYGTSLYRYRGEVPEMPVFTPEQLASPGVLQPGEVWGEATELAAIDDWVPAPGAPAPTPDGGGSAGDTLLANDVEQVPAVLLGSDDRARVNPTTGYPARTIGKFFGPPGKECTASLIGPRHAITAAHCVNGLESFEWIPGQNGDGTTPNGGPYSTTHVYFRSSGSTLTDYAVLGLPNSANIASLGWMGMWWSGTMADYDNKYIYLKGYPLSNQTCAGQPCNGYMWGDNGVINHIPQATGNYGILYYPLDTTTGQSGSAIYSYFNDIPAVLGVHSRSNGSCRECDYVANPPTQNVGPRLTQTVYNDICWMMGEIGPSSYASHPCT